MQLYAITGETGSPQQLLSMVEDWTAGGVHYLQLREKHLEPMQLASLAKEMKVRIGPRGSKLLVNLPSPALASVALAAGADGVHLAGKPVPGAADVVRQAFRATGRQAAISLPCHSLEEVELARMEEANLILFSPIFEKFSVAPQGLDALRQACAVADGIPVFALGGVTLGNAAVCQAAGAAGVAGIRLFAGNEWRRLPIS